MRIVAGETPNPPFSAALGLAAALCNLLRVGVLWCVCVLVFSVKYATGLKLPKNET